ncbi:MAG TPA: AraC family transcriptional regulator [Gammaproteobacteria bacterium]
MDALSDVLRVMRLSGGVFLNAEFTAPWCLRVSIAPNSCAPYLGRNAYLVAYHFVLEGHMRVRMPDGEELDAEAGQSVLFPHNDPHLLGSDLALTPVDGDRVVHVPADGGLSRIVLGGGGARTRIVCGFLGAEDVRGNPVVAALPAALRLDVRNDVSADWVRNTFCYAAEEIAAGRPGSAAMMAKLSEILLVEAIRRYAETLTDEQTGWLAALRDPYLARAVARLHADVAASWTVDALARRVGLSRSALAERFTRVLGMPPMQYLAQWRMHVAAQELRASGKSIAQIAEEVGYESEASFTRAFKRALGMPPAAWRRQRETG